MNSLLGDLENVRFTRRGHMKGDLYDGREMIAEVTFHARYIEYGRRYNLSYLDGRFRINTSKDEMVMFDDDIQRQWIGKAEYFIDV